MKLELEVLARTSIKRKKPWPRTAFIGEVRPHFFSNKFYHAGFVLVLLRGNGERNSFVITTLRSRSTLSLAIE